jgi:hypothetical protein
MTLAIHEMGSLSPLLVNTSKRKCQKIKLSKGLRGLSILALNKGCTPWAVLKTELNSAPQLP